jgi:putative molybdopterin biosynthesis protein
VQASHDLALPALRELAGASEQLHIELRFAGSMDSLRALAEGRCTVAGFHVPPLVDSRNVFARGLKPLLKPGRHKLIGCMQRTQGLLVAKGNPLQLRTLADLEARGARFVNRQEGSGTRLLTDHLLAQQKVDPARIPLYFEQAEDSHIAVAAAVASGVGDAAMGIEAAAQAFGLDFVPLMSEDYFLVCLAEMLEQPAVQTLRRVLQGPAWRRAVDAMPGYRAAHSGEVLSLTRALPWWNFRSPKVHGAEKVEPQVSG